MADTLIDMGELSRKLLELRVQIASTNDGLSDDDSTLLLQSAHLLQSMQWRDIENKSLPKTEDPILVILKNEWTGKEIAQVIKYDGYDWLINGDNEQVDLKNWNIIRYHPLPPEEKTDGS